MSVADVGPAKREVIENFRPSPEAPFSAAEYRERIDRIRAAMMAAGVDCLFLSAPESIHYVSGYAAEWYQANSPAAWAPAAGIAIHVDHADFIHFEHVQEATLIALTSISADVRLTEEEGEPQQQFIVDELAAAGWLRGSIGLEMGCYRPNRLVSESFQAILERAGASVLDATSVVRQVRRRKSAAELDSVREAQRIADVGLAAARASIAPGITELEVYGEVVRAMARAGGEVTAIPMPVVSGPRAQTLHGLAGRRKIEPGDLVGVDVCGVYNRYHANTARSFAVGGCEPSVARCAEAVYGAVEVYQQTIRPGLPVRDLHARLTEYYKEAGIWGEDWWVGGYELGVAFPPDWVGDFLYSIDENPGDKSFLPGDVNNFEANFYAPDLAGIIFCINTVVVENERAGFLQSTPSRLEVV